MMIAGGLAGALAPMSSSVSCISVLSAATAAAWSSSSPNAPLLAVGTVIACLAFSMYMSSQED